MIQDSESEEVKSQSITMSTIIGKAIEAIVAYIVLWFFEPLWKRIVKWWKGKNESNS
jgi:uncharacterized membrane protein